MTPMKLNCKGKTKIPEAMSDVQINMKFGFFQQGPPFFGFRPFILGVCLNYHDEFHVFSPNL